MDTTLEKYRKSFETIVFHKEIRNVNYARTNPTRKIPPTNRTDRLHSLSELALVSNPENFEVLLPADVSHRLGQLLPAKRTRSELRWPASGSTGAGGVSTSESDSLIKDCQVTEQTEIELHPDTKVNQVANHGVEQARSRRGTAISNKSRKGG